MNLETHLNPDSPELRPYFRLRKAELIEFMGQGYFIAETYRVIHLLLDSNLEIHSLLGTKQWFEKLGLDRIHQRVPRDKQYVVGKSQMEKIVGFNLHQGIMAIAKRPKDTSIESLKSPIVAFNGVVNPENIGSITRSAIGLGYESLLVDEFSADPYLRRAVRVSMGNVFQSKVHLTENLEKSLRDLQCNGWKIIGSDIRHPTASLPDFSFPEKFVLIIGSEFEGMSEKVLSLCDEVISIPATVAINAANAASILLYAGQHQRSL